MIPSFHDGNLIGLSVFERTATVSIVRADGVRWRIELSGVRHLKADDFREGNIISYCEVVTTTEPPRELLMAVARGPDGAAAQEYHDRYRRFIDGLVEQIKSGHLSLLYIEPSYGCDVIAICERIEAIEVC
jgi:hypothetical protein